MKKIVFMVLSMTFVGEAWSKPGFYSIDDFPRDWVKKEVAHRAWQALDAPNSCTYIPIGPKKILTAAHCLRGKYKFKTATFFEDNSGFVLALGDLPDKSSFLAGGTQFPVVQESLVTPKSWTDDQISKYREAYSRDWAILSYEGTESRCIEAHKTISGERFVISGYPAPAKRPFFPSNGEEKYISYGKRYFNISQTTYYKTLPGPISYLLRSVLIPALSADRLLLLDADSRPGNSGGPIIDEHGYLVGVVVAGLIPGSPLPGNRNQYHRAITLGVTIGEIFSQLAEMSFDPSDLFNCNEEQTK